MTDEQIQDYLRNPHNFTEEFVKELVVWLLGQRDELATQNKPLEVALRAVIKHSVRTAGGMYLMRESAYIQAQEALASIDTAKVVSDDR